MIRLRTNMVTYYLWNYHRTDFDNFCQTVFPVCIIFQNKITSANIDEFSVEKKFPSKDEVENILHLFTFVPRWI